jgi:four helix bundle protein
MTGIVPAGSWSMTQQNPLYEDGQDIRDRTFEFACAVAGLCRTLYDAGGVARMLVPQLLACSTSLASMLEEARAAESTRDFISKCSIALKEARESLVRLRIVEQSRLGPENVRSLRAEANELVAIVTAIIRNTKQNSRNRKAGKERIPNS